MALPYVTITPPFGTTVSQAVHTDVFAIHGPISTHFNPGTWTTCWCSSLSCTGAYSSSHQATSAWKSSRLQPLAVKLAVPIAIFGPALVRPRHTAHGADGWHVSSWLSVGRNWPCRGAVCRRRRRRHVRSHVPADDVPVREEEETSVKKCVVSEIRAEMPRTSKE